MNASVSCKPGQQVELGRYETAAGTRALIGRRIKDVVHVYDFALDHAARPYFVEAGFESMAELAALVADYRRQAQLLGESPMSGQALDSFAPGPKPSPSAS